MRLYNYKTLPYLFLHIKIKRISSHIWDHIIQTYNIHGIINTLNQLGVCWPMYKLVRDGHFITLGRIKLRTTTSMKLLPQLHIYNMDFPFVSYAGLDRC